MDARDQEKAFEKLLARALRKSLELGSSDCPGPDLLAAYLEHSLSDAEAAQCERHFAQCARCQQALAAADAGTVPLSVGQAEAPVTEKLMLGMATAPAAQPMETKAAVSSTLRRPQEVRPRRRHWGWLVPAVGAVAAVVLWVAIRSSAPRPVAHQPSEEAPKEIAQNNPPVAPANKALHSAGTESKAKPSPRALVPESRPTKPGPQPPREGEQATAAVQPRTAEERVERRAKTLSAEASRQESTEVGGSREAALARKDQLGQPLVAEQKDEADKTAAARAQPGGAAGAPETPKKTGAGQKAAARSGRTALPAQPAPAMAQQPAEGKGPAVVAGQMVASVARRPIFILIPSPDASVQWRVGPGGSIAQSRDAGRTWQPQVSNVKADLAAGSAPSEGVCWVVGRAGTILRTTDGMHWETLFSPAPMDWVAVEARDALNATVVAANRHRYVTDDGGQSWRGPLGK